MKFLFALLFSSVILFACSEEKQENEKAAVENLYEIDTSAVETTPVESPDESFLMRDKMELNQDYRYRIASFSTNTQTIQFDTTITQDLNQKLIYIINIKPAELDKDSIYDVVCTFNSIKLDADANGQTHSYES